MQSETPKKVKYERFKQPEEPVPNLQCICCGLEKHRSNLKTIDTDLSDFYLSILKRSLLIELAPGSVAELKFKICALCIKKMEQIISMRNDTITRLDQLRSHKRPASKDTSGAQESPLSKTARKESSEQGFAKRQLSIGTSISTILNAIANSTFSSVDALCEYLLTFDDIKAVLEDLLLKDMDRNLSMLCGTQHASVLNGMKLDHDITHITRQAILELRSRVPYLFKVLVTASDCNHMSVEEMFHIFSAYGILMRSRHQRMNALQQLVTAACLRHHAGNKLMELLYKLKITMAESSKTYFLNCAGLAANARLVPLLSFVNCKVTIDNIDWRTIANQVRMKSGNKDFHYTHWTILPDRFQMSDLNHLSNDSRNDDQVHFSDFYCTKEDNQLIKNRYAIIIAKILCEELDSMTVLQTCMKKDDHEWSHIVDKKSEVFPQEVILETPNNLPSCVRILQHISNSLGELYKTAGRGEEYQSGKVNVTLGGDQLVRVLMDSAKGLVAGAYTPLERLDHLCPVMEELFHVQQDLLEKIVSTYYDASAGRVQGSLSNLKAELHRTNVTGVVKSNNGYEAHRDFTVFIARMLILELHKQLCGDVQLPSELPKWTLERRKQWLLKYVRPIVDEIYVEFTEPNRNPITIHINVGGTLERLHFPPHLGGTMQEFLIEGKMIKFKVPLAEKESPFQSIDDDLVCYNFGFVRSMMDFMLLDDVIKTGNVSLMPPTFKRLLPLFIGLASYRSKYSIEMIDSLTKIQRLYSARESTALMLRALVNRSGKHGKNKPADMQQENNIKAVKNVVKGLGANKTDTAVVRASLAAPALGNAVEMLRKSVGLGSSASFSRKKKTDVNDKERVQGVYSERKPFVSCQRVMPKRILPSPVSALNKHDVDRHIQRNARRTMMRSTMFEDLEIDVV